MTKYIIFFFSLIFDYKGIEDGGGGLQFAMFTTAIASGIIIISSVQLPPNRSKWYDIFKYMLILLLVSSGTVAIIQDVEFGKYSRVVAPYLLLAIGYFVGIRAHYEIGFHKILNIMMITSVMSIIFSLYYGFTSSGQGVGEIRYQILSPLQFIINAVMLHNIFINKKHTTVSVMILIFSLITILISATRSALIEYFTVIILAFSVFRYKSSGSLSNNLFRNMMISTVFISVLLTTFALVTPDISAKFMERFLVKQNVGLDITAATRIAEINYQIESWLSDLFSIFFGKGLGATYSFSGEVVEQLIELLGYEDSQPDWWFAGHNFWIYSLYSQGILFGWIVPFAILKGIYFSWKSIISISTSTKQNYFHISESFFCFLALSSIVLSTIGGNMMGVRVSALYLGIILSLTFAILPNVPERE